MIILCNDYYLWKKHFVQHRKRILCCLKSNAIQIHHIGSTSIPNLYSKNIVDILLVVNNINNSICLSEIGYKFKGEYNVPMRYIFSFENSFYKVHLHVCESDNNFIDLNLKFRDFLLSNEDEKNSYINLKKSLANGSEKSGISSKYTLGKNLFIKNILKKTKFDKLIVNFCSHEQEWFELHKVACSNNKCVSLCSDLITIYNHRYFCLYKGVQIVSYMHVEMFSNYVLIRNIFLLQNNSSNSFLYKFVRTYFIRKNIVLLF